MATKKHHLTVSDDKIKGTSGKDLFVAGHVNEQLELNATDRLDGRQGLDTIRSELAGPMGAPILKNIEIGVFEALDKAVELDLKNAPQMRRIELSQVDELLAQNVQIRNAGSVDTVRLDGSGAADIFQIEGLDSKKRHSLSVVLTDAVAELGLFTISGKPFRALDITLSNVLGGTLSGGATSARDVTIHSVGGGINQFDFDPGMYGGTTRHLTIEGNTQFMMIYNGSEIFQHLYSVDLTDMKATSQFYVGGEKLTSIEGGIGADALTITELGGSAKHKAEINLGGGTDGVFLVEGCYDAAMQRFDGGKGWDAISFEGAVQDIAKGIRNFEAAYFYDAAGTYDLSDLTLDFYLGGTTAAVTFDHVRSGSSLSLLEDSTNFLTINVENAAGSKKESLSLFLDHYMSHYGNSVVGLLAPDLSELNLDGADTAHTFYLTSIGSTSDGATLNISGSDSLSLVATTGSWSYIDKIVITNTGGVDLSGLENGTRALLGTGATITGGAGDDVLVGSISADTISTGGGDNTVLGSLNADKITFDADSGLDKIVYRAEGESSYGLGFDTVENFSIFDALDVSAFADVIFVGNFTDNASGIAALSTTHQRAFFNTTTDTLYIDIDHDKALGLNHDMQIVLTGLSSFSSSNLIS